MLSIKQCHDVDRLHDRFAQRDKDAMDIAALLAAANASQTARTEARAE